MMHRIHVLILALFQSLGDLIARFIQNPGYGGAVLSFYGLMALQLVVQIVMVPIYLDSLGKVAYGALMALLALVNVAGLGIASMQGGLMRAIGERYFDDAKSHVAELSAAYTAVKLVSVGYGAIAAVLIAMVGYLPQSWLFGPLPAALSQDLQTAVFLAALYYLALNDMASEYWTLTAAKRQMEANVSLAVGPVIFLILVILWLRSGGGLGGVVGCLAFGTVISAIVARFFRRWRIGRLRLVFGDATKTVMGELLGRNVLPYAVYGGAFTLLQADTLVVSVLGGAAMAAEFVLVWKIAEILILLLWKISESLQPYLIEADVQGDHSRISEFYRMARLGTWVCALIAGVFYAVFGPDVIALWVGDKHAPANPLYFVAAGGAVFWMASARVPVIFAYTFKRFGALNRILICEVVLKLGLVVVLVSQFSYGAPLIAINIVHVFGIAWAYVWLGKTVVESPKSHNS